MGYMHINNLYKNQTILMFKECFAMEKIHGTSAHIKYKKDIVAGTPAEITFFSGGGSFQNFVALFNKEDLMARFDLFGKENITVYGESYGGKMQGMSGTYGKEMRFVVFDIEIDEHFLGVENADNVAQKLGLEFVHYKRIPAKIEDIDAERDAPSVQAVRNGILEPKQREGVVLRPIMELFDVNGGRIISKHKGEGFGETKTERKVDDPEKLMVLSKANEIADEWVTENRLEHVLQKLPGCEMKDIPKLIDAMYEDVIREAEGEIIESKDLRKSIGVRTAKMFKKRLQDSLHKPEVI
jgi:hypothetical protein